MKVHIYLYIFKYRVAPPKQKTKKKQKKTEQSIFQDFALINSYLFHLAG